MVVSKQKTKTDKKTAATKKAAPAKKTATVKKSAATKKSPAKKTVAAKKDTAVKNEAVTANKTKVEKETKEVKNPKNISMWRYYIECLTRKYCKFKGRANRKEFWGFTLFDLLISFTAFIIITVIAVLMQNETVFDVFRTLWWLIFLLPGISVKVRRLHDINLSGWWLGGFYLLILFFIIALSVVFALGYDDNGLINENWQNIRTSVLVIGGFFILIYTAFLFVVPFLSGTKASNKYGDVPEGIDLKNSAMVWIALLVVILPVTLFALNFISGYSDGMLKYKANKATDNTITLINNIRSGFAKPQSYIALSNERALAMGLFPKEMVADDNGKYKVHNAFGGGVVLRTSGKFDEYDNKAFTVTYDGLSKESCIYLASLNWGYGSQDNGFIGMQVFDIADYAQSGGEIDTLTLGSGGGLKKGLISASEGEITSKEAEVLCSCKKANTCAVTWKFY